MGNRFFAERVRRAHERLEAVAMFSDAKHRPPIVPPSPAVARVIHRGKVENLPPPAKTPTLLSVPPQQAVRGSCNLLNGLPERGERRTPRGRRQEAGVSRLAGRAEICALTVMAKVPRPCEAKTRLGPPLGAEEAPQLRTCFLKDVAANFTAAAEHAPAHGYVASRRPVLRRCSVISFVPRSSCAAADQPWAIASLPSRGRRFGPEQWRRCLVDADSPTQPPALLVRAMDARCAS
jgi:hypothetical protein